MNTKQLIIASALGLSVLSTAAMADFAVYNDSNHLYAGFSSMGYYFDMPDLKIGSKTETSNDTLTSVKTSKTTWMPRLTLGFHFNNAFLPSLFGQKANIEANGGFASFNTTDNSGSLGRGYMRLINGDAMPYTKQYPTTNITNFSEKTQTKYQFFNVMFRGDRESQDEMISQHPEFGFVYSHLTQDNSYGLTYDDNNIGPLASDTTTSVSENIDTHYYGLAMGDDIKFQLSRHIFTHIGGQLQVLHASATLNGSQSYKYNGGSDLSGHAKADNNLSAFTYRTILTTGISYAFTVRPDSPSVGVDVGYDRLGFTPTVVNPTGPNKKAAHLDSQASNNVFAGLNVHLPL